MPCILLGKKGLGHMRPVSDGAELWNLLRGARTANLNDERDKFGETDGTALEF